VNRFDLIIIPWKCALRIWLR